MSGIGRYRLSKEAISPAQIHDCKVAIRWIRTNAPRLGADPRKIGVWGSSAGRHFASLVGTSGDVKSLEGDCGNPEMSSRVACVVDFCGPSDFLTLIKFQRNGPPVPRNADSPESQLLDGRIAERQELAMAASPVTYATRDDPPFLIVHGTADRLVPVNQAEGLYASPGTVGPRPTMLRIERGGHSIGGEEVLARVSSVLRPTLARPTSELHRCHDCGTQVEWSKTMIRIRWPSRETPIQGVQVDVPTRWLWRKVKQGIWFDRYRWRRLLVGWHGGFAANTGMKPAR